MKDALETKSLQDSHNVIVSDTMYHLQLLGIRPSWKACYDNTLAASSFPCSDGHEVSVLNLETLPIAVPR